MSLRLIRYYIVSPCFRELTGATSFTNISEVPEHKNSSMLFIMDVGEFNSKNKVEIRLSVVIRPTPGNEAPTLLEPGLLVLHKFDAKKIMNEIMTMISKCENGSLDTNIPILREFFEVPD